MESMIIDDITYQCFPSFKHDATWRKQNDRKQTNSENNIEKDTNLNMPRWNLLNNKANSQQKFGDSKIQEIDQANKILMQKFQNNSIQELAKKWNKTRGFNASRHHHQA